MKAVVLKFGGSTLKDRTDLENIKRIIETQQPFVLVVSAVNGVTDMLSSALNDIGNTDVDAFLSNLDSVYQHFLDKFSSSLHERVYAIENFLRGAKLIGEVPPFVYDYVISQGERCSSLLLTMYLNQEGIPCEEMLPETFGLVTDGTFGNATVNLKLTQTNVKKYFRENQNYVVPGFYGVHEGKVNVLGRGGSDYTATSLAYCLDAKSIKLYKDVPGFMSSDPKTVSTAKVIKQLSYAEAAELSYFGAKILHHASMEPAMKKNIPVYIYDVHTLMETKEANTVICANSCISDNVVKSISSTEDIAVIQFNGDNVGRVPGILGTIASAFAKENVNIKSVVTSQTSINVLVSKHDVPLCMHIIENMEIPQVQNIVYKTDISLIAAVGDGLLQHHSIAARIFSAVSKQKVNVEMISAGASDVTMYFIVRATDREKALKAIHEAFFGGE
ncbi:aspartate kinase [Coprothermobacter platensis]|uniref:aspartate kinase n=1 Tax=Coprothermobacter platensis TaxID=108819 RepID=UPI0003714D1C|nr:aspartate kinase [Coprothermobacter platensis]